MTRQDFIDNVQDFGALIDFCNDEECGICEGIYSDEARDEKLDNELVQTARESYGWRDLLATLQNITTGYDWYSYDDWDGEWVGINDAFDTYKERVLAWGDENLVWEDDEEEPLPEYDEGEDDDFVADEPISIGELMGVCNSQLRQIGVDKKVNEAADDEAFEVFVASCATIVDGG